MSRVWAAVMSQTKKNCEAMDAKYKNMILNRSKFTFGRVHAKAIDPEAQIKHRKEATRQISRSVNQKIQQLRGETEANLQLVKEERLLRLQKDNLFSSAKTSNDEAQKKAGDVIASQASQKIDEMPRPATEQVSPVRPLRTGSNIVTVTVQPPKGGTRCDPSSLNLANRINLSQLSRSKAIIYHAVFQQNGSNSHGKNPRQHFDQSFDVSKRQSVNEVTA